MEDSRRRARDTIKQKYGEDHFSKIGSKSASFKDSNLAKLAAMKRWHPEKFDSNGSLIEEKNDARN